MKYGGRCHGLAKAAQSRLCGVGLPDTEGGKLKASPSRLPCSWVSACTQPSPSRTPGRDWKGGSEHWWVAGAWALGHGGGTWLLGAAARRVYWPASSCEDGCRVLGGAAAKVPLCSGGNRVFLLVAERPNLIP